MDDRPIVYVIDDEASAREAIAQNLAACGMEAMQFSSARDFLKSFDPNRAGCVVTDLRMPDLDGLELLASLRELECGIPVIVISAYGTVALAVRAVQGGAVTFLEKPCSWEALWEHIREAVQRDREQRGEILRQQELCRRFETLTKEEWEVLGRVLAGVPNRKIAEVLSIGLRTVELRRSTLMKKVGATCLPELVRMHAVYEAAKNGGGRPGPSPTPS